MTFYCFVGPNCNVIFHLLLSLGATAAHFYISFSDSASYPPKKCHTANQANHGLVWSRPRPLPLVRTVVQGTFHTCNFGLDETEMSDSSDQTRWVWKRPCIWSQLELRFFTTQVKLRLKKKTMGFLHSHRLYAYFESWTHYNTYTVCPAISMLFSEQNNLFVNMF